MNRRRLLGVLGASVGLSGCLSSDTRSPSGTTTPTETPTPATDGYPPASAIGEVPPAPSVDPSTFERLAVRGTEVPLVPIDVAIDWYRRREARFADARGQYSYNVRHVLGAVSSPASQEAGYDDPVQRWPTTDRIVTYCGCPHHLSSLRAKTLIESGYENVYALDEGVTEWRERQYPMAGSAVDKQVSEYVIRGETDPAAAGEDAWAWHDATGQREAAMIESDGSYELHLKFTDISDSSVVRVETPTYSVSGPLSELTADVVTAADAQRA